MLYIKNKMKYPVLFKTIKNGREERFSFDCRRVYKDTGNIATTGVTPISEEDYKLLYENSKVFKDHIDKDYLALTKESGVTESANKVTALEKENEVLKKQLAEKTKEASTANSEELEKTKAENESLKAQLEALKKGAKDKKEDKKEDKVDESEGF